MTFQYRDLQKFIMLLGFVLACLTVTSSLHSGDLQKRQQHTKALEVELRKLILNEPSRLARNSISKQNKSKRILDVKQDDFARIQQQLLKFEEKLGTSKQTSDYRMTALNIEVSKLKSSYQFPYSLLPFGPYIQPFEEFFVNGSGYGDQSFNSIKEYEQWLLKLNEFPALTERVIARLEEARDQGVMPSKAVVLLQLNELRKHQVSQYENSVLYTPLREMPSFFLPNQKQYLILRYTRQLNEGVLPAIDKLVDYLESTYLPAATDGMSIYNIPFGRERYQALYQNIFKQDDTLDTLHNRLFGLIADYAFRKKSTDNGQVEVELDVQAIRRNSDPVFEPLEAFKRTKPVVAKARLNWFDFAPRISAQVVSSSSSQVMHYKKSAIDQLKPAEIAFNSSLATSRNRYLFPLVLYRYYPPGQHLLDSFISEYDTVPQYLSVEDERIGRNTWDYYAQYLVSELPVISDENRKGMRLRFLTALSYQFVDISLHHKMWSPQRIMQTVTKTTGLAEQDVERMIKQALLYPGVAYREVILFSQVKSLKQALQRELGSEFDLQLFNRALLESVMLPYQVIEQHIRARTKPPNES